MQLYAWAHEFCLQLWVDTILLSTTNMVYNIINTSKCIHTIVLSTSNIICDLVLFTSPLYAGMAIAYCNYTQTSDWYNSHLVGYIVISAYNSTMILTSYINIIVAIHALFCIKLLQHNVVHTLKVIMPVPISIIQNCLYYLVHRPQLLHLFVHSCCTC